MCIDVYVCVYFPSSLLVHCRELANTILVVGKAINFLRTACGEEEVRNGVMVSVMCGSIGCVMIDLGVLTCNVCCSLKPIRQ